MKEPYVTFKQMVTKLSENGQIQEEVENKRSYNNGEIAYNFFVQTNVLHSLEELQGNDITRTTTAFVPNKEKKIKLKKPNDYQPRDFAQKNQEKLPFTHSHEKSMHQRKTMALTNKFVHEGEFQEEQNIVFGADETAKSVYIKKTGPD